MIQLKNEIDKIKIEEDNNYERMIEIERQNSHLHEVFWKMKIGAHTTETKDKLKKTPEDMQYEEYSRKTQELYREETELRKRKSKLLFELHETEKRMMLSDEGAKRYYELKYFLENKNRTLDSLSRQSSSLGKATLPLYLKEKRKAVDFESFTFEDWKTINSLLNWTQQVTFPDSINDWGERGIHNQYYGDKIEKKLSDMGAEFQESKGLIDYINQLITEVKSEVKSSSANPVECGPASGSMSSSRVIDIPKSHQYPKYPKYPKCKENEVFDPTTQRCEQFHFEVEQSGSNSLIRLKIGHRHSPQGGLYCTHSGFISCVQISPELQGQGLGKKLLDFAIKNCRTVCGIIQKTLTLEVYRGNLPALKNYLAYGFKIVGVDKSRHDDDAFKMEYTYPESSL